MLIFSPLSMNDLFQTGALPDLVEKDLSKIESRKTIA
jgi:hypothetical protein